MAVSLRPEVLALQDELVSTRRHFHKYPELSFKEFKTAEFIAEKLRSFGLHVTEGVGKTGVVGILRGSRPGPCILLRADMDALPIPETGDLPYASVNEGVMHACGHDAHMAMLLTTARIVSTWGPKLAGNIKFVFQPAEEGGGGAKHMIEDSKYPVLEADIAVDAVYGMHVWNYQEAPAVGAMAGPVMAASGRFQITVHGTGGHGAAPQGTVDAVLVGAHLVTALHSIVSRNIEPLDSAVLTVGAINGGYESNVIADTCILKGTTRSYSESAQQLLLSRIKEVCDGVGVTFGARIDFTYFPGYPAVINHSTETEHVLTAARKIVPVELAGPTARTMASEDFAFFLRKRPGCFFFVGSAPAGSVSSHSHGGSSTTQVPHHCSHFTVNEDALAIGASVWVQLVEDLLCLSDLK
eukprot:GILJ01002404.1.p1 GENE.GILJ01002404.1~~GILJ01002404.1.p1  ORF type:complete len:411 (-),score=59.74 GILJ01002404.1:39-1271(-)